jgi:membrane associated rhomboid family serine protease
MNSAAVGFQCPECVKEGARTTRAGRLRFGGMPTANPQLTTLILIATNALVWLLVRANGGDNGSLFGKLALLPQGRCALPGGRYYLDAHTAAACATNGGHPHWIDGVTSGAWWQVLTSTFTHVDVLHIGFNMLALWFLGPIVEMMIGRIRYLAVYFVSAIAGSAAVMLFAGTATQTVGASGAIFGLMGALIVIGHKIGAQIQQIWMWLGLNLVITFTASGISWQGHLGGLIGGALAAAALVYAPRERRTPVQAAGLGGILVVSIVLILVRVAALS